VLGWRKCIPESGNRLEVKYRCANVAADINAIAQRTLFRESVRIDGGAYQNLGFPLRDELRILIRYLARLKSFQEHLAHSLRRQQTFVQTRRLSPVSSNMSSEVSDVIQNA
jgi:hypothetical protein